MPRKVRSLIEAVDKVYDAKERVGDLRVPYPLRDLLVASYEELNEAYFILREIYEDGTPGTPEQHRGEE